MFKNFRGNKKPYLIRLGTTALFFVIILAAFISSFKPAAYIMQFNFAPAFAKLIVNFSTITLAVVLVNILLAFAFGRFYCSVFCPLGILQDIIGSVFRRKSGKTQNFYYIRYIVLAIVIASIFSGINAIFRYVDPYSNFGNIITGFVHYKEASLYTFIPLVILIVLVVWKNRIFCTTVCPVGTILGLCSKFGLYRMYISPDICKNCGQCEKECPTGAIDSREMYLDNERCIRCMKCIAKCPGQGILFGIQKTRAANTIRFEPSRRNFIATGVVLVIAASILAKGKDITKTVIESFKNRPILPPGAGSPEDFAQKCTNCGLCIQHCKGNILKKPNADYETIHIDFSKGKCDYNCKNCSDICPTGAIKKMSLAEKQNIRIGLVKFDRNICSNCGQCANICPKGAIEFKKGQEPVYNPAKCIGCGACQNICPVHAIEIVSINKQSQI